MVDDAAVEGEGADGVEAGDVGFDVGVDVGRAFFGVLGGGGPSCFGAVAAVGFFGVVGEHEVGCQEAGGGGGCRDEEVSHVEVDVEVCYGLSFVFLAWIRGGLRVGADEAAGPCWGDLRL